VYKSITLFAGDLGKLRVPHPGRAAVDLVEGRSGTFRAKTTEGASLLSLLGGYWQNSFARTELRVVRLAKLVFTALANLARKTVAEFVKVIRVFIAITVDRVCVS